MLLSLPLRKPRPRIIPFRNFCSKFQIVVLLLLSSSSWARAAPGATAASIKRPSAPYSALRGACRVQPDFIVTDIIADPSPRTSPSRIFQKSPASPRLCWGSGRFCGAVPEQRFIQESGHAGNDGGVRSEEHTSELQSLR